MELVIGLFIGGAVGFFTAALMQVSKDKEG